jgi:adenosylcobinamide-GDP ribazoletransferase
MTTLAFRLPEDWTAGDSGRAAVWYPLVGLVIGAFTWLAWKGATFLFPSLVTGVITLAVWVFLTGGLHLDGLADCCDGLFASVSRERRLEIMKDPHVGTFGVIGLILILFLKAAALASLTSSSSLGILLAATLARWCILSAGLFPLARSSGMAADFKSGLHQSSIMLSAIIPLTLLVLLGLRGIFSAFVGILTAALILWIAKSRIGGVTGDVFGMIVEVVETTVLLTFLIGA